MFTVNVLLAQNEVGSEMTLLNIESYGQYFAQALTNANVDISETISETMSIDRENIREKLHLSEQLLIAYCSLAGSVCGARKRGGGAVSTRH